jgi:hypothetical protein
MNSLRNLLRTKSIIAAAAVVAAGAASAPAIGQSASIVGNTLGSPASGVVCRAGYSTDFSSGTALKCRKSSSVIINLSCDTPRFPTYLARARVPASNKGANGEDICIKLGSTIGPNDTLNGLPESTNGTNGEWEFAKVNMTKVATEVVNADQAEATAVGLPASGVETLQSITFPQVNAAGLRDKSATQITHYTFAIPTGGLSGPQGPIGLPATASPSAFVPRPIPR